MKHALVPLGEYTVPLIGIQESAVNETCDGCGRHFHLSQIKLVGTSYTCLECLIKTNIARLRRQYATDRSGPESLLPPGIH